MYFFFVFKVQELLLSGVLSTNVLHLGGEVMLFYFRFPFDAFWLVSYLFSNCESILFSAYTVYVVV